MILTNKYHSFEYKMKTFNSIIYLTHQSRSKLYIEQKIIVERERIK